MQKADFMAQSVLPKEMIRSACGHFGSWKNIQTKIRTNSLFDIELTDNEAFNLLKKNQTNLMKKFIQHMSNNMCSLNALLNCDGSVVQALTEPHICYAAENKILVNRMFLWVSQSFEEIVRKQNEEHKD